jgi:hypothetical protein
MTPLYRVISKLFQIEELRYIVLGATGIQIYKKLKHSVSKSPSALEIRLLLTQIAAEFC